MCIVGFTTRSKGWGARSLYEEKSFSFVSRNCNLLHHDDEPLGGYLSALCCPQLLIKWYGFYPKTKKKGKELEHKKNVKNVSMHQENDRKAKTKSSILGIFNIFQYYFPMSSTFLVLSPVSPITP
jgi:hypothetical protein